MFFLTWLGSLKKKYNQLRKYPTRILALGFAIVILLGGFLLWLPFATREPITLFEAMFTSTSAVCVTGLVVVDTGTRFTLFGHIVLMLLIQTGGLGFMSMATLVMMIVGKRITLRDRLVLQESMGDTGLTGLVRLTRWILGMTLTIETIGAVLLSTSMIPRFGLAKGIFYSIFHSISAFCNAGFDLMGNYTSLTSFRNDPWTLSVMMLLIITGGLGYAVIRDLTSNLYRNRLSLHTKIVLTMTGGLIALGTVFFLLVEWANPETLAHPSLSPWMRPVAALFQSVTLRTAGFNTITQAAMTDASKMMSVLMMFVGASPASTGGGLKTTTTFTLVLVVISTVKGREDHVAFGKRLPRSLTLRALALGLISVGVAISGIMAVTLIEYGFVRHESTLDFLEIAFEVLSALGTVGLSCDLTSRLSSASHLLLMVFMFAGRVGPLTLTLALARRQQKGEKNIRYPEERIMIG